VAKAQPAETGGDHQPPRRRLLLLLGVRAAVVTALLGSTLFFALRDDRPGLASTQWIVFVLAGLVYLLSALYALWLRRPRGPLGLHLQIQTLFDVLLASVLVYISGGLESPFTFFYALPIITSAAADRPARRCSSTAAPPWSPPGWPVCCSAVSTCSNPRG